MKKTGILPAGLFITEYSIVPYPQLLHPPPEVADS